MITEFFRAEKIYKLDLPDRLHFNHAIDTPILHCDLRQGKYEVGHPIPTTEICSHKWKWYRVGRGGFLREVDILWAYCEKSNIFFYCYANKNVD